MWAFETLYPDIKLGLKGELIYKEKTAYQDMKIYRTEKYGNAFFIDGAIQTTEKDEFIYHEMMTHPVMLLHPNPKKVLIIGGGDGGILREVLKYRSVKEAVLVEIDERVIDLSKKYLKSICKNSFNDKRTDVVIADGAEFAEKTEKKFDIVIIDSPDPVGVATILFSQKFYKTISSLLTEKGLIIRQTGSTTTQEKELRKNWKILTKIFPNLWLHLVAIPTYIGGFFSLTAGSFSLNLLNEDMSEIEKKFRQLEIKTRYYNPYIHMASALLPEYVREIIR